jgi:hypothetical protein
MNVVLDFAEDYRAFGFRHSLVGLRRQQQGLLGNFPGHIAGDEADMLLLTAPANLSRTGSMISWMVRRQPTSEAYPVMRAMANWRSPVKI